MQAGVEGSEGRSRRAIVRAGYDTIGDRYHAWSHASPIRRTYVAVVLDRLPRGSSVVDLGCGPGDPATRLLSEHHRVLGVDLSMEQLRIARRFSPKADLVQADLAELALRKESVDAVVSFYALGHLPSAEHAPLLHRISGWLRPGGLLVCNAPLAPGDGVAESWLGVPMFFGGIGQLATVNAVHAAGLALKSAEPIEEDEGDGTSASFLWVTAVKAATPAEPPAAGPRGVPASHPGSPG